MNYKERQQIVEALKAAKLLLWDGIQPRCEKFICVCLMNVRRRYPRLQHGSMLAENIVQTRVHQSSGGFSTIENYLCVVLGCPRESLNPKDVQEFRHRWVDHLIEEFSR